MTTPVPVPDQSISVGDELSRLPIRFYAEMSRKQPRAEDTHVHIEAQSQAGEKAMFWLKVCHPLCSSPRPTTGDEVTMFDAGTCEGNRGS